MPTAALPHQAETGTPPAAPRTLNVTLRGHFRGRSERVGGRGFVSSPDERRGAPGVNVTPATRPVTPAGRVRAARRRHRSGGGDRALNASLWPPESRGRCAVLCSRLFRRAGYRNSTVRCRASYRPPPQVVVTFSERCACKTSGAIARCVGAKFAGDKRSRYRVVFPSGGTLVRNIKERDVSKLLNASQVGGRCRRPPRSGRTASPFTSNWRSPGCAGRPHRLPLAMPREDSSKVVEGDERAYPEWRVALRTAAKGRIRREVAFASEHHGGELQVPHGRHQREPGVPRPPTRCRGSHEHTPAHVT